MRSYLTLFLFVLCTYGYSQNQVAGTVIDDITKEGVMGVSVYINNTTFGAKTDINGEFFFYCPISGKADIVASHINYVKTIQSVNLSVNQKINLSLQQKETNLTEVVIRKPKSQSQEDKAKWFKLFSLNLIGNYVHRGDFCKITNPEVLNYDYDVNTKKLSVTASGALLIENLHLGYKINLDLEEFEYNFLSDDVSYKYTSLYEELKKNKPFTAAQITLNRNQAYYGSAMHFMRSLYSNQLVSEGFNTFKYLTIANVEKKRVADLIRVAIAGKYETELNPKVLLTSLFSRDSAAYYASVMKQPNAKSVKVEEVATQTLISKNRLYRTINFNFADTLRIDYSRKIPEKVAQPTSQLKQQTAAKPQIGHGISRPLTTYLYFFEPGGVNIENTGYYPDFKLFMYGDMAERRIGSALPYDFEPLTTAFK